MTELCVRRFVQSDAYEVSDLIIRTLRTSNIKDYSAEYIENDVKMFTPESVLQRASWTHFYVAVHGERIVGCGAIGPYWGKEDESSLFNIFVLPEYQGRGVGKRIMETLEKDVFFLRAKRVEIPSSVTACEFYKKLGYTYKNGVDIPDEEGLFRLEKWRENNQKNKYFSFIDKRITLAMSFGWLAISALLILLPLAHWGDLWCEDPLMAVLCPIAGVICFAAAVLVPLSGMMITKKGTIVFLPDFRLKTFRMTDLKRVVLNFNECRNKKYSVTIKFIAENGKVFMNDYSVHFRNRVRGERLAMAMYTVSRKKVDRICEELSDVSICIITIIDQDQRIVYQTP